MKGFMCITLETIKIFHDKNEMDKFLGSKQEMKVSEKKYERPGDAAPRLLVDRSGREKIVGY